MEEKLYTNKEWLFDHYINKNLSPNEIADLLKVGRTVIRKWLKKLNIPIRNSSSACKISSKHNAAKTSTILKEKWQNPKYRKEMINKRQANADIYQTKEFRENVRAVVKERWEDVEYHEKGAQRLRKMGQSEQTKIARIKTFQSNEYKEKMQILSSNLWERPEFKDKMLELFTTKEYKHNHSEAMKNEDLN